MPGKIFDQVIKQAHKESHDFLTIDLQWKKGIHLSPFRRNLDTYLVPTKLGVEIQDA